MNKILKKYKNSTKKGLNILNWSYLIKFIMNLTDFNKISIINIIRKDTELIIYNLNYYNIYRFQQNLNIINKVYIFIILIINYI